jgi:site-specific recombinase XerD
MTRPGPAAAGVRPEGERPPELTAAQLRRLMISEFRDWLGTRTSRDRRPFQPDTIAAYADAAIALDAWMSAEGIEAEFTGCGTATLNRFFAAYHAAHGQGGTNTKQRNLRQLFTWLEREHDHPHPYTDELQRYSPAKNRPSTLAGSFITDLLEVTGGGKARRFADARDHAIIRVLTEGVRRT